MQVPSKMEGHSNRSLTDLWFRFAELTQRMVDMAMEEQWEEVAAISISRQEIEQQLRSTPVADVSDETLAELMSLAQKKNLELTSLAKQFQENCQTQVSTLAAGKKAAAAYSL